MNKCYKTVRFHPTVFKNRRAIKSRQFVGKPDVCRRLDFGSDEIETPQHGLYRRVNGEPGVPLQSSGPGQHPERVYRRIYIQSDDIQTSQYKPESKTSDGNPFSTTVERTIYPLQWEPFDALIVVFNEFSLNKSS